jgi:hypothetical protein
LYSNLADRVSVAMLLAMRDANLLQIRPDWWQAIALLFLRTELEINKKTREQQVDDRIMTKGWPAVKKIIEPAGTVDGVLDTESWWSVAAGGLAAALAAGSSRLIQAERRTRPARRSCWGSSTAQPLRSQ